MSVPQAAAAGTRRPARRLALIALLLVIGLLVVAGAIRLIGQVTGGSAAARIAPGTVATAGGTGVSLRPVDGGADFYSRFSPSLPADPGFFPIGVWLESVTDPADTVKDKEIGLNTYLEMTGTTNLDLVRAAGMYTITSPIGEHGEETGGWLISDEADMWAGPGDDPWTGNFPGQGDICQPADGQCGYTVQQDILQRLPDDQRLRMANYGKGIAFWQSDEQAARFVNEFADVVSVDTYWFTDRGICGHSEGGRFFDPDQLTMVDGAERLPAELCHRAANYGRTIDRVRALVSPAGSKPVWSFVEVGRPFNEEQYPTIKPEEVVAAVWSSLIHGARGIVYFNHSFSGPCLTQHALREPCYAPVRAAVADVNERITRLAPVLNAPYADGVATVSAGVDLSAKWHDGHFYLIAGSAGGSVAEATFAVPCVGDARITVLDEERTLSADGGTFTDSFIDGNAVHVYRIDGGSSCGAY
ncbi:hypothetical protein [Micromonospora sp. NBC_01813]|uniref:hypothetical protein n=1 Tax=Micromonospora sp. NBC_01813 TaxID=2975988 RepID=UPI002DDBCD44|nr:hypothetical protein [Micromonospora sp. NBC_01813]WSA08858.1 hypothetical protein OG958_32655 [Micromonospora sp. NBC_01813]